MSLTATTVRFAAAIPAGLCLAALLGLAPAQGDEAKGLHGYLSLGAAAVPDYEGSADYTPAPMFAGRLSYDEYYLDLRGPKLRANVMPAHLLPFGLDLGPAVAYRFGRGDVQDDRIDRMRDIDGAVAAGGFARVYARSLLLERDELGFEVETLSGIGSDSHGTTVKFGPSYSFWPWERLRVGFAATTTYASDRYNEAYFGIDAENALRSGLDPYRAKGGIKDIGLTVNATYQWTDHWGLTGTAGVTRLLGDAADSPIVKDAGSATQGLVTAGVVYSF
jgi:outer membrane scaffolding protein for murein synthesis (MipA/OmpV family)